MKREFNYSDEMGIERGPDPFPGVYPTRWAVELEWRDFPGSKIIRKWRYFGKPSVLVARFVMSMGTKPPGARVRIWEMDRGGVFTIAKCASPFLGIGLWAHDPGLHRFYYPWEWAGNHMFLIWGQEQPVRFTFVWKGQNWLVYAPFKPMLGQLGEHKLWLEKQKFTSARG